MDAFERGVQVLRIGAEKGNAPSRAILDELAFRQSRIDALHELNSDLNELLRDTRLQVLQLKERLTAFEERERLLRLSVYDAVMGVAK